MEFPLFQVPYLGNGMTIGIVAVVHVLISHGLAIGAMTMVVLSEYLGFRDQDPDWENFSRGLLLRVIIIITGVGAVTGVGIWVTTSVLSPRGIGSLLRVFYWPWFMEWLVFVTELVILLVYYFTWDHWTAVQKRRHVYLGAGYILMSLGSASLITGILGFMLTPDGWPWEQTLSSAFFNPTFLPQLLLRLAIALTLGSLFAMAYLLFSRRESRFRREAGRLLGRICLVAVALIPSLIWWYYAVVPSRYKTHIIYGILTSHLSQHPGVLFAAVATALVVVLACAGLAWGRKAAAARVLVIPALVLSVVFVFAFERSREFMRGPYLIPGYLYATNVLLQEKPFLDQQGLLPNAYWFNMLGQDDPENQGAFLLAQNCSACHTIGGLNDIRTRVKNRSEDGIFVYLSHINEMVPFMPPFSGTEAERRILARFLYRLAQDRIHLSAPSRYTPLNGEVSHE
ncbi:MAG: cytochrome C [Desulfobaccales bacterium]